MIQVGSKEEVELLLALFGSHAQPSNKKPRWTNIAPSAERDNLDILPQGESRKQIIRIPPALICAIPIRSFRTKWSQMQNIRGHWLGTARSYGNRASLPALGRRYGGGQIMDFTRGALLWLLGVPLPIILLIALFWHHWAASDRRPRALAGSFCCQEPLCPANHKWRITLPPRWPADCRRFRESTRPIHGVGKRSVSWEWLPWKVCWPLPPWFRLLSSCCGASRFSTASEPAGVVETRPRFQWGVRQQSLPRRRKPAVSPKRHMVAYQSRLARHAVAKTVAEMTHVHRDHARERWKSLTASPAQIKTLGITS